MQDQGAWDIHAHIQNQQSAGGPRTHPLGCPHYSQGALACYPGEPTPAATSGPEDLYKHLLPLLVITVRENLLQQHSGMPQEACEAGHFGGWPDLVMPHISMTPEDSFPSHSSGKWNWVGFQGGKKGIKEKYTQTPP